MEFDFFLLTTCLLEEQDNKQTHIRCLGSREIQKPKIDTPRHILGTIEFESSQIPVVDLGAAFGIEPIRIDHSTCILIVKQDYRSQRIHTGIVVPDFEDIERIAAGISGLARDNDISENVRFVLEMDNRDDDRNGILVESHRLLSLLAEPDAETVLEQSSLRSGKLFNLLDRIRNLDLPKRHLFLEELANKPELWDKERNVMVL